MKFVEMFSERFSAKSFADATGVTKQQEKASGHKKCEECGRRLKATHIGYASTCHKCGHVQSPSVSAPPT